MNEKQILIIAPSWVGDMMMAHSLFQQIKQDNPNHKIGVVAPKWSEPLLQRMPEVSDVFTLPVGHNQLGLKARWQLAKRIQSYQFDVALVLPRSIKSALIPWFANIPKRVGYIGEQRYGMVNHIVPMDKSILTKTVDRFVYLWNHFCHSDFQASVPSPKLQVKSDIVKSVLDKYHIEHDIPSLVICPGAEFGPSKQWPSESYRAVAVEYLNNGYQVIILGSPNDKETGLAISKDINHKRCFNLIEKTTLNEAVDIISVSEKVLTNDSGLMHIASALDRPLVAIYGSTSPKMTPPLANEAIILQKKFDCQPCFKRQCPLKEADKHHQCMKSIHVNDVLQVME